MAAAADLACSRFHPGSNRQGRARGPGRRPRRGAHAGPARGRTVVRKRLFSRRPNVSI